MSVDQTQMGYVTSINLAIQLLGSHEVDLKLIDDELYHADSVFQQSPFPVWLLLTNYQTNLEQMSSHPWGSSPPDLPPTLTPMS